MHVPYRSVARLTAWVPWLCVPALRRVCPFVESSGLHVALDDMYIAAECSSRSMIPPTHASVRANADTGAARKIRTFQPVDDEPWSNQVMTSTPLVHVHSETPRLCVACHEHGTTLNGFLPVSWDHVVASYGTTRRVAWGGSSARLFDFRVMFVDPTPS